MQVCGLATDDHIWKRHFCSCLKHRGPKEIMKTASSAPLPNALPTYGMQPMLVCPRPSPRTDLTAHKVCLLFGTRACACFVLRVVPAFRQRGPTMKDPSGLLGLSSFRRI